MTKTAMLCAAMACAMVAESSEAPSLMTPAHDGKSSKVPWQDESVSSINRLPARSAVRPCSKDGREYVLSLDGEWDFEWKNGDARRKAPDVKVLMLTTSDGDEDVFMSMNKGARGYMVKDESGEDLHVAIRTVASGEVFLPKRIKAIYDDRKKRPSLSEREIEIVRLVAKGFSNDELAERLHLSPDTVKAHLRHVYEKLGVESRVEAVTEAMRTGLVEAP